MDCQSTCSTLIYLIKSIGTTFNTPISNIPNDVRNFVMVRQIRWQVFEQTTIAIANIKDYAIFWIILTGPLPRQQQLVEAGLPCRVGMFP